MLDAIAGLSALTGGVIAPVSLRRTYAVAQAKPASESLRSTDDRLELSPGHIHENGQTCPICGTITEAADGVTSDPLTSSQQAGTGSKPALLAEAGLEFSPGQEEQLGKLKQRDQEVRAHEQAHKAAGGQFAGSASYSYQVGPDGHQYAVGGEVSVDISPVPGDPQATIAKMQQLRRAALAPAQPSSQDLQVAAQASRLEAEARAELARPKDDNDRSGTGQPATLTPRSTGTAKPASRFTPEAAGEGQAAGLLLDVAI